MLQASKALKLHLGFAGDALDGAANGGCRDQVGFKRVVEARVEALKYRDLYVDQKSELSRERCQGLVAVGDCFKKVVDSNCGMGRLRSTLVDAVVIYLATPWRVDNVLISR